MDNTNFLVVEDSPTMRQLISFSLKRFKNARIIEAVDRAIGELRAQLDAACASRGVRVHYPAVRRAVDAWVGSQLQRQEPAARLTHDRHPVERDLAVQR